jgi:glycosyltransferase involved in cell wall biosynthesis
VSESGAGPSMKLAFFLPSLKQGGVARTTLHLIGGLCIKGHEIYLVVANSDGELRQVVPPDAEVVDLEIPQRRGKMIAGISGLTRFLKDVTPDVLISAKPTTNVAALLGRRWSGLSIPVVIGIHHTTSRWLAEKPWPVRGMYRRLLTNAFNEADRVIAVSQGVATDVLGCTALNPHKLRVIPNAILDRAQVSWADKPVDHPWFGPS